MANQYHPVADSKASMTFLPSIYKSSFLDLNSGMKITINIWAVIYLKVTVRVNGWGRGRLHPTFQ